MSNPVHSTRLDQSGFLFFSFFVKSKTIHLTTKSRSAHQRFLFPIELDFLVAFIKEDNRINSPPTTRCPPRQIEGNQQILNDGQGRRLEGKAQLVDDTVSARIQTRTTTAAF